MWSRDLGGPGTKMALWLADRLGGPVTGLWLVALFGCAEMRWEQMAPTRFCDAVAAAPLDSGQPREVSLACVSDHADCDEPGAVLPLTEGQIWNTHNQLGCLDVENPSYHAVAKDEPVTCLDDGGTRTLELECWLPAE